MTVRAWVYTDRRSQRYESVDFPECLPRVGEVVIWHDDKLMEVVDVLHRPLQAMPPCVLLHHAPATKRA